MQAVTKYRANDGQEFDSFAACEAHESIIDCATKIMSQLPAKPEGCDFSNGDGFIQHTASAVMRVRNEMLKLARRYTDHRWIQETIDGGDSVHISYADRIISEAAPTSFYRLWNRFVCIDKDMREWGQPYYANHPDQGKQVCLNATGEH